MAQKHARQDSALSDRSPQAWTGSESVLGRGLHWVGGSDRVGLSDRGWDRVGQVRQGGIESDRVGRGRTGRTGRDRVFRTGSDRVGQGRTGCRTASDRVGQSRAGVGRGGWGLTGWTGWGRTMSDRGPNRVEQGRTRGKQGWTLRQVPVRQVGPTQPFPTLSNSVQPCPTLHNPSRPCPTLSDPAQPVHPESDGSKRVGQGRSDRSGRVDKVFPTSVRVRQGGSDRVGQGRTGSDRIGWGRTGRTGWRSDRVSVAFWCVEQCFCFKVFWCGWVTVCCLGA